MIEYDVNSEFSDKLKMIKTNYFQNISSLKMYSTIRVPAFEFNFNLVVCPLQETSKDVS